MTIEMLDQKTILVSLGAEDMRLYALDLNGAAGSAEIGLKNLLYRVGDVCGLDHRGKSYLIEALPASSGCLLIISVRAVRRRRVFRIKRDRTRGICVFFDADAMLDYLSRVRGQGGYAVYRYEDRYVLLPAPAAPLSVNALLGEYGELYSVSETVLARIREYGVLLCEESVQRRHIGGGAVTVGNAAPGHGGG